LGYTAGKWREWYPDVVAEEGDQTVSNELLGETKGSLGLNADKYLWQSGWWAQHQRLLAALAARGGSRFIVSGDIHALAAERITQSGDLDLSDRPVTSLLSGPVSSSDGTWPSAARGVQAAVPAWLKAETLVPVTEVNSYTIIEITKDSVSMHLRDCGGYDRSLNETGEVLRSTTINA
jgi:phosphodiesterase/alkaline phosphatase D-like protein